jgi:hypothetical protein
MPKVSIPRVIALATLASYAALLVGVWLSPPATIDELTAGLPTALDASLLTYRVCASVLLSSGAALVMLATWSWQTRPRRPFRLSSGEQLSVDRAETLVRRSLMRRPDIRSARVTVIHRSGGVAALIRIDVTPDALLADIEDYARRTTANLAERVGEPLSDVEITITFQELNLVAARARLHATADEQLRAA